MTVPTYKRSVSPAQFIEETRQLNIRLGQIIMNYPTKYRQNYGDFLIKSALKALQLLQSANKIFITKELPKELKLIRYKKIIEAEGIIENISSSFSIYAGLLSNKDGINREKLANQEVEIGTQCFNIINLLDGLQKSDKKYH